MEPVPSAAAIAAAVEYLRKKEALEKHVQGKLPSKGKGKVADAPTLPRVHGQFPGPSDSKGSGAKKVAQGTGAATPGKSAEDKGGSKGKEGQGKGSIPAAPVKPAAKVPVSPVKAAAPPAKVQTVPKPAATAAATEAAKAPVAKAPPHKRPVAATKPPVVVAKKAKARPGKKPGEEEVVPEEEPAPEEPEQPQPKKTKLVPTPPSKPPPATVTKQPTAEAQETEVKEEPEEAVREEDPEPSAKRPRWEQSHQGWSKSWDQTEEGQDKAWETKQEPEAGWQGQDKGWDQKEGWTKNLGPAPEASAEEVAWPSSSWGAAWEEQEATDRRPRLLPQDQPKWQRDLEELRQAGKCKKCHQCGALSFMLKVAVATPQGVVKMKLPPGVPRCVNGACKSNSAMEEWSRLLTFLDTPEAFGYPASFQQYKSWLPGFQEQATTEQSEVPVSEQSAAAEPEESAAPVEKDSEAPDPDQAEPPEPEPEQPLGTLIKEELQDDAPPEAEESEEEEAESSQHGEDPEVGDEDAAPAAEIPENLRNFLLKSSAATEFIINKIKDGAKTETILEQIQELFQILEHPSSFDESATMNLSMLVDSGISFQTNATPNLALYPNIFDKTL